MAKTENQNIERSEKRAKAEERMEKGREGVEPPIQRVHVCGYFRSSFERH